MNEIEHVKYWTLFGLDKVLWDCNLLNYWTRLLLRLQPCHCQTRLYDLRQAVGWGLWLFHLF